jgi:hypothetical protein
MTARDQGRSSEAPAGHARNRMLWMRIRARWLGLAALVVLGAYLATGVYVVDTDEEASCAASGRSQRRSARECTIACHGRSIRSTS